MELMPFEDLIKFAEKYQYKYPARVLIDLMFLYKLWVDCEIGPEQPVLRGVLQRRWHCCSQSVSRRLGDLVKYGFASYIKGNPGSPGYRFTYVGLPPGGVPLLKPISRSKPCSKRKTNHRKPAGSVGRAPKQRKK